MKLKTFENYNNHHDDKILCIYDYTEKDINWFKNSLIDLTNGITFTLSDEHIQLNFQLDKKDIGVKEINSQHYCCLMTKDGYINMIDLISEMQEGGIYNGYQWLYDLNNPIDLLLSNNSTW